MNTRTRPHKAVVHRTIPVGRKSMRVVEITGKRECQLTVCPYPNIRNGYAIVKVHAVAMNQEASLYHYGWPSKSLGGGAAGEVVEIAGGRSLHVGDRVLIPPGYPCGRCDHCLDGDVVYCVRETDPLKACGSPSGTATYGEYCIKPTWLLRRMPDDVSYDHMSIAFSGLGTGFGAMRRMRVSSRDVVLVVGVAGSGLGSVISAAYFGAMVIAVERNPFLAHIAGELGALSVLNPDDPDVSQQILQLTRGKGVDKSVECTGTARGCALALQEIRPAGEAAFVARAAPIGFEELSSRGLTIHRHQQGNWRDTTHLMSMIARSAPRLERVITHRFAMSDVALAWERQLSGECGEIVLHPQK